MIKKFCILLIFLVLINIVFVNTVDAFVCPCWICPWRDYCRPPTPPTPPADRDCIYPIDYPVCGHYGYYGVCSANEGCRTGGEGSSDGICDGKTVLGGDAEFWCGDSSATLIKSGCYSYESGRCCCDVFCSNTGFVGPDICLSSAPSSSCSPVDGGWSSWSDWDGCSSDCDGGTQTRTRTCTNPSASCEGSECSGDSSETQDCNTDECAISASLSVDPSSGDAPLNDVDLSATVTSNMTSTFNYTFYCNRSDDGVDITSNWIVKYDGVTDNPKIAVDACDYSTSGSFTAKVIIEQGSLSSEDREGINVSNESPIASSLSVIKGDYCSSPSHYFSWTYSDADEDTESKFQFQVDNNNDFSSPEVDQTQTSLSYSSPTTNNQVVVVSASLGSSQIEYGTTYYWRAKVWDSEEADSGWIEGSSFTTESHIYPSIDFSWLPENPSQDENVTFSDQSMVYGDAVKSFWSWIFEDGDPSSSSQQNPIIEFIDNGSKEVTFQVTDSDGFSCSDSKTIDASFKLPDWKEILPW